MGLGSEFAALDRDGSGFADRNRLKTFDALLSRRASAGALSPTASAGRDVASRKPGIMRSTNTPKALPLVGLFLSCGAGIATDFSVLATATRFGFLCVATKCVFLKRWRAHHHFGYRP
jgi:hypothetical protein